CDPHGVAYARVLDKREYVGNFELAAECWTVALRDGFDAPFAVAIVDDDQTNRHVGGDDLPGRARVNELALEPRDLRRTEEIGVRTVHTLVALTVRPAIAAHVQHKDVE